MPDGNKKKAKARTEANKEQMYDRIAKWKGAYGCEYDKEVGRAKGTVCCGSG